MKRILLTTPILTAVLALGFLTQCGKPTEVHYRVISGTVYTYLNPRMKITWKDDSGGTVNDVFFTTKVPCTDKSDLHNGSCTVRDTAQGFYRYTCKECQDPEIEVGSDIGGLGNRKAPAVPGNTATPPNPIIYCDDSKNTQVDPKEVTGKADSPFVIGWLPEEVTIWTVTSSVCMESTINQDTPVCTVQSGTKPGSYSYMAKATTPACGEFTATITVMAK